MRDFRDKVVVITGAGSGMGRAYAQAFAARGATLALNDYDAAALEQTLAGLPAASREAALAQAFDVADAQAMQDFAAQVQQRRGGARVLINNAGIEGGGKPVWATPPATLERVMRVNFYGVVQGTQAFLPQLLAAGEGAIVNVSSIFGLIGPPNHADYAASKFAVRGYTEALMVELAQTPISVHLVHPGGIATNIARSAHTRAFAQHYLTTPPARIVEVVIRGIAKRRRRIVYGRDALRTWLAAALLPLWLRNRLIWRDMAGVIDRVDYPDAGRDGG